MFIKKYRNEAFGIMRVIRECVIIFGITLAGELLNLALPFPVPAGVYGLFLLLALLLSGALKLEQVEETGNFLLEIMPILFVPAAVGLTESYEAVKEILFPLLITCLMSTVIVMAVTGKVTELMIPDGKKRRGGADKGNGGKRA